MTFLQFRKIARWSIFRAALLGTMGIVILLFPEFSGGGIIYAVVAYAILNGALGIIQVRLFQRNQPHIPLPVPDNEQAGM